MTVGAGPLGESKSASPLKPDKPVKWRPLQPLAFFLCVLACPRTLFLRSLDPDGAGTECFLGQHRTLPLRSLDLVFEQAPSPLGVSTAAALWLCDVLMC